MSYEERNTLAALVVNLMTTSYMILKLRALSESGILQSDQALIAFGKAALWVIPMAIVGTIVLSILGNVLYGIVTGNGAPSFVKDERDVYFESHGIIVTMVFIGLGFVSTMALLAMGKGAIVAFTTLYFAFAAGDFFGNVYKIIRYRTGY